MPPKIEKSKKGRQKFPETHAETKDMRLDADAMAKIVAELTLVLIKAITTAIESCMTNTLTKQINKIEDEQSVQIQQQSLNALFERDKLERTTED